MASTSNFFGGFNDFIGRVMRIGRRIQFDDASNEDITALCHILLKDNGHATSLAIAAEVFDRFDQLDDDEKDTFFSKLTVEFELDRGELSRRVDLWQRGELSSRELYYQTEPLCHGLMRKLNRIPGGTAKLVAMREQLLTAIRRGVDAKALDQDFKYMLGHWFNRGFLTLQRIDWSTSAEILEKIIAYEAVHEIQGWDDLRLRVGSPDRRLYAFFHPAMPQEPLVFVEVALANDTPKAIATILQGSRSYSDPSTCTTAVFYSISNCQYGLRGISFGNFLIKQVVEELRGELSDLERFVTLSPVPGLRRFVEKNKIDAANGDLRALSAKYLSSLTDDGSRAIDPVAHFHLGNGAQLEAVHLDADLSETGQQNAMGVMVNYLYDLDSIEANHESYMSERKIVMSPVMQKLASAK